MEMNYDEQTLRQIEEELDTKIYPGTEVMADVGTHHFVKSSHGGASVLVPQPSADPADPLNWSPFWKTSAMAIATGVSFMQGLGPLALAPMFRELMKSFDADLADVVQFTGVSILVLGFSNFIWVPLQTSFGRRPVLLFSSLICLGSMIWRARAQTYGSFMGACVLNGIGAGPAETAQPQIIADVMFLHERGKWQTWYFTFYFGSLMVGPIISGPIAFHNDWRNFWWLNVALFAALIIATVFLFPETKWHRLHPAEVLKQTANLASPDEKGIEEKLENGAKVAQTASQDPADQLSHAKTAERDPYLGKGRPSKQQFKLFQPNAHPFKSILLDLYIPWKLFLFPIVEFSSFVVSWSASVFLTLNLTQSQVFAEPPYEFSSQSIGFMNFAVLVGALIGLFTNGVLSDWIAMRLTVRNRGIREPEMRLVALVPYVIIMVLGNFVVAFGYQYKWPWEAIVIIGYTCAGIQVTSIPAISSTYSVDSYKPVAGSVFVAITVNKNVWGYGFSKFITPWTEEIGFVGPIMLNMCLTFVFCASGVLFYYYGKTFRKWTRGDSVHTI